MGILDDAIKEHLELKRSHGADASELKQLEDEAFGAAERPGDEDAPPDAVAEAPTEFMEQPALEADDEESAEADAALAGRRERHDIADLQEAPPAPEAPAEEEAPAMEHEAVPEPEPEEPAAEEPEPAAGHSTEERHAIAEHPTEMYDVEEEMTAAGAPAPADEELIEEEMAEPHLAPAEPLPDVDDEGTSLEDDEFWDEKRLSDELDQALDGPSEPSEPAPEPEPPAAEASPEPLSEPDPAADEDVLEETPEFLEEAPEDDRLWFEQKPPKDFDFDD